jgi:predicted RNase H-like nuclease
LIAVPRNEPGLLAGVDGCNGGWVVATRYSEAGGVCCFVVTSIAELFQRQPVPDLVAIDVPIGLPESGPRQCDVAARRRLGRFRGTSVFAAPVRAMLPTRSYEHACRTGRAVDGRALSRQCWSILPKIREVDALVTQDSEIRSRVREVHPEVSFAAMAGTPILEPKRSKKGQAQRLELLERVYGGVVHHAITGCRKDGAKPDDVLDAFVALWSAARIHSGSALAIPNRCETDPCGITMQIFA